MKIKITILSDSHGNFHALKSLINDAEKQDVQEERVFKR